MSASRHIRVDIATRTIVRTLLIVITFGLGLLFIHRMANALKLLGLSFFLALALNSSVSYLARHLPGRSRALATGVSYLAVVFVFGVLLFSTVPTVFRETTSFIETIPGYVDDLRQNKSGISKLITKYNLQDDIDRNLQNLKNSTGDLAATAVSRFGQVTSSIATVLTVLVLTFLMLVEAPRWQKWLWGLYGDPKMRKRHQKLASRMYRVITGYVNGQVAIAAIGSTSSLVVLLVLSSIFNTSSTIALPLAGIIFVAELIPMVGVTIGAIVVSLFLLLSSLPMSLIFLAWFTAYQQFENYLIQPVVQSKALDLSPLVIFSSALLGFYLMGPIGGFIAIPLAGCGRVLLLDFLAHRKQSTPAEQHEAEQELEEIQT
ncbi:MAG TPA: AI-2E family transporter [Candidatus Saccharimonadales bacterium]|nr:AI-2E family transporter [Candidatus Saccharimonadales bacterium]